MWSDNIHTITSEAAPSERQLPDVSSREVQKGIGSRQLWYALRVYYSGPKKILNVKKVFDDEHIENFLPMKYEAVVNENGKLRPKLVPAFYNLIFIKTEKNTFKRLKEAYVTALLNVDYIRPVYHDGSIGRPIVVPMREMRLFLNTVKGNESQVEFFDYEKMAVKTGRPVKVISGRFKGAEGLLKRVKNNRHVVIELKGVIAAVLDHIPISEIRFIN